MAKANQKSKNKSPRSFSNVVQKIIAQGEEPRALNKLDWCQFGDALAKDIDLQSMLKNKSALRIKIKQKGGIAEIWRQNFPIAARRAMQRYGRPAYNIRWQYVCQWGQQCNESDMMSMTSENSSSSVRETSQSVDANVIGYRIFTAKQLENMDKCIDQIKRAEKKLSECFQYEIALNHVIQTHQDIFRDLVGHFVV